MPQPRESGIWQHLNVISTSRTSRRTTRRRGDASRDVNRHRLLSSSPRARRDPAPHTPTTDEFNIARALHLTGLHIQLGEVLHRTFDITCKERNPACRRRETSAYNPVERPRTPGTDPAREKALAACHRLPLRPSPARGSRVRLSQYVRRSPVVLSPRHGTGATSRIERAEPKSSNDVRRERRRAAIACRAPTAHGPCRPQPGRGGRSGVGARSGLAHTHARH